MMQSSPSNSEQDDVSPIGFEDPLGGMESPFEVSQEMNSSSFTGNRLSSRRIRKRHRAEDGTTGRRDSRLVLLPPKLPQSSYILFFREERAKNIDAANRGETHMLSLDDLSRLVEKKWNNFSQIERIAYEEQEEQDRVRYDREMEEYEARKGSKNDATYESLSGSSSDEIVDSLRVTPVLKDHSSALQDPVSLYERTTLPSNVFIAEQRTNFQAGNTKRINVTTPRSHSKVSNPIPLPSGMEIELQGQKFKVGYTCQTMSIPQAQHFAESYGRKKDLAKYSARRDIYNNG